MNIDNFNASVCENYGGVGGWEGEYGFVPVCEWHRSEACRFRRGIVNCIVSEAVVSPAVLRHVEPVHSVRQLCPPADVPHAHNYDSHQTSHTQRLQPLQPRAPAFIHCRLHSATDGTFQIYYCCR